jgi:hypothetical protein
MLRFKTLVHLLTMSAISLIGGAVFYIIWLAIFLVGSQYESALIETVLWVLAPFVTALGFTSSLLAYLRYKERHTSFLSIYIWPLGGCILGAILVYWYGPMLIVFSMLGMGTIGVILRELKGPDQTSTLYPPQRQE